MGRILTLRPQFGALRHAEAVLLIHDRHPQPCKAHRVFYHRMGTHQNLHLALGEPFQCLLAPLSFDDARQKFHLHVHTLQKTLDGVIMLLGQNLRGSHDASLKSVVKRYEHRHEGHQRLARAHIALQQTVHLPARAHVAPYLAYHPLLGCSERERQVMVIKLVEEVAHVTEDISPISAAVVACVTQDIELYVKQFFKLQAQPCLLHFLHVFGIMYLPQSVATRDEMQRGSDIGRQCLGQRLGQFAYQRLGHLLHAARGQSGLFHALRSDVIGLHAHFRELERGRIVHIGMGKLVPPAVHRGFSEDNIFRPQLVGLVDILRTTKPDQVHDALTICKVGHHTLLVSAHLVLVKT